MAKDPGNERWALDCGDNLQLTATVRAVFDVAIEHAFTKALPGFRPSGRHAPFKIAGSAFVSN